MIKKWFGPFKKAYAAVGTTMVGIQVPEYLAGTEYQGLIQFLLVAAAGLLVYGVNNVPFIEELVSDLTGEEEDEKESE